MSDEFYCVTVTSSQCKQQILQQQFYNIDNQIQGATTNNNHLLPSSKSCSCTTSIHVNSCIRLLMYMRSYVIHVRILCKNVCLTKCSNSIDLIQPSRSTARLPIQVYPSSEKNVNPLFDKNFKSKFHKK